MESNKIIIQSILADSADDCIATITNDQVKKTYMLPDFASYDEAYKLFSKLMEISQQESRYVRGIYLGDKLIGFINDPENTSTEIELGWVIHPDYQNKGYCTKAVKLAIAELFDKGYTSITAGAFPGNIASMRVMEKCGMHRIDKTERIEYRGETYNCIFYEKTKRRA